MNRQKVKKDLLLAASSNFFDKIAGYLIVVMLARYLTKESMGAFFFAATLTTFLATLSEAGMNQYLIREVAGNPGQARRHFSVVISIRLALLTGCFIIVSGGAWLLKSELAPIIILTAAYVFLENFYHSLGALFLGLKRVIERVVTSISAKILLVVLIFWVINGQGDLNLILISYIVANTFLVGFALLRVRTHIGPIKFSWRVDPIRSVLRISFPLFILTILGLIHFKVDTLMLGFLQAYTAVANYEAGFKLLEISRFVIRPVVMIFFPICAEMVARQNWSDLQALSGKMFLAAGALGIGIGVLVVAIAGLIIPLVFGPQYDEAIPVLRVLYLSLPALYMGMVSLLLARSLHLEKQAVKILMIGVLVNIGLNSLAIPLWGALGAAMTTVVSETILTAWLVRLIWQKLRERSQEKPDAWQSPVPRSVMLLTRSHGVEEGG